MRTIGLFRPGGYATHLLVPHPRYLVDASGIPEPFAATLACAGLTAFVALGKAGPWGSGDPLVLIGAGGVGLTAVRMAMPRLGRAPWVLDPEERSREAARRAGAAGVIDPTGIDVAALKERAGGEAAAVIDFVGTPQTVRLGLDLLHKGGRLVLVGLYGGSLPLEVVRLPLRNLSVVGSLTGTLDELRQTVDFVRREKIELPVHTRPLAEADRALRDLHQGEVSGRSVLINRE
jgi:D-arabinose 1-dehydrogenase-like Zn-dependent alcohol dehydrogenase